MKTASEIRAAHSAAATREHLASMRAAAMDYRMAIAPDSSYPVTLEDRGHSSVFALEGATAYRDMARNLGRWSPERVNADLQMSWEGGCDE